MRNLLLVASLLVVFVTPSFASDDKRHLLDPVEMLLWLKQNKGPPQDIQLDRRELDWQADVRNFRGVTCIGNIGPYLPYSDDLLRDFGIPRNMTCEKRDAIVNALGATAVFLKGTSYVCSMTPLPQAQIAARVFDVSSFASASIGFVISLQNCRNTYQERIDALLHACQALKDMGVDCISVDSEFEGAN